MATNINDLLNKEENGGTSAKGKLTATEFTNLVSAVKENQDEVKKTVKSVTFNGIKSIPDETGNIKIVSLETNYVLKLENTVVECEEVPGVGYKIAHGSPFTLQTTISHMYVDEAGSEPQSTPCKLTYYCNGAVVGYKEGKHGDTIQFDFGPFLSAGDKNIVYVSVDNNLGNSPEESKRLSVAAVYLDVKLPTFDRLEIQKKNPWDLTVSVDTIGESTVYILIDDELVTTGTHRDKDTKSYQISAGCTTGLHTIKVYAETQDKLVQTTPIEYSYLYSEDLDDTILIASLLSKNATLVEYHTLKLQYWMYTRNFTGSKDVSIKIVDAEKPKTVFFDIQQKVVFDKGSSGLQLQNISLFGDGLVGPNREVIISCEGYEEKIPVKIEESKTKLTDVPSYLFHLSSANKSNASMADRVWEDNGYSVSFPPDFEFSETGSGWNLDKDGNTALHIRRNRFLTLHYKPFAENPYYNAEATIPGNGKGLTFSIEFATRNCTSRDSSVVSCMNNGIGFELYANSMRFASNSNFLACDYKEDIRVRLDLVIQGKDVHYNYTDLAFDTQHEADEALMLVYVDGVYQGLQLLTYETSFKQPDPQEIKIGSTNCDIDIYSIRAYDTALDMVGVLKNYAYDTPRVEEKIAIAERNDIFSDRPVNNKYEISLAKLRTARPDLPIMIFTGLQDNKLPVAKKPFKDIEKTEYINPLNKTDYFAGNASFVAPHAGWGNQGTSSMQYPLPYRNFDWKIDWDGATGETKYIVDNQKYDKYVIYEGMDPVKNLTFKKDYASSEMVNNVICSDLFNTMAEGIADLSGSDPKKWKYADVLSPTQVKNGKEHYKLALKGIPSFMFYKDANLQDKPMGMFNIIPNKYEVGYLGFVEDNVWDPDRGHFAQSWEIQTNDVNWSEYAIPIHAEDKEDGSVEIKNNLVDSFYEARYPKKSPVTKTDFGQAKTTDQFDQAWSEHKDLFMLHNWFVDTNKYYATGKKLSDLNNERLQTRPKEGPIPGLVGEEYRDLLGNVYTVDNREYRLAKFKTEATHHWSEKKQEWVKGGYLRLEQWILYYIWMEQYWMYDSGAKNLQIYTMGKSDPADDEMPLEWGTMVRDADTGLGIDNVGKLSFPPHLEYSDYKVGNSFLYNVGDRPRNEFNAPDSKYELVLNGQECAPWQNIKDAYAPEIAEMYRELINKGTSTRFGYKESLAAYEDHQAEWAEGLYDFGSYQYFGGDIYSKWILSGLGDKKNQRRFWLYYGFKYRGSKYETGTANDSINWRADGRLYPFDVQVYAPMYVTMYKGRIEAGKSYFKQRCADPAQWVTIPGSKTEVNDVDFSLTFGDMYTDLSQLYKFSNAIHDVSLQNGKRLRKLGLGNHLENTHNYSLDTLNANFCSLLEVLDITGCANLGGTSFDPETHEILSVTQNTLDISKLNQLQEFYAENSTPTTILLPKTSSLKKINLGSYLVSLNLVDLPSLEEFTIQDTSRIKSLLIENVSKKIDTYALVVKVLENKELSYLAAKDIEWNNVTLDFLEKILDLKDSGVPVELSGIINIKGPITFILKNRLLKAFGNIDSTENSLYVTYEERDLEELKTVTKLYFRKPGDYPLEFKPIPLTGNNFTRWEWTIDPNPFATVSPEGILHVEKIGDEESLPSATVTITVYKNDGLRVQACMEAYFYNRVAKPGYYVFQDGTYGPELEVNKTPIGVCFWVDPDDDQNRLMVATQNIGDDEFPWGPTRSSHGTIAFKDHVTLKPYEVPGLPHQTDEFSRYTTNESDYRVSSEAGGDKYGFRKNYPANTFWYQLGNYVLEHDELGYRAGTKLPFGKYFTELILNFRDKALKDSAFLDEDTSLPKANVNETVLDNFLTLLRKHADNSEDAVYGKDVVFFLYFPAATACASYNPLATTSKEETIINEKFREGNWFLPSAGELGRIQYYYRKTKAAVEHQRTLEMSNGGECTTPEWVPGDPNNVFQKAVDDGVLKLERGIIKTSSLPSGDDNFAGLDIYTNNTYSSLEKTMPTFYQVLPVCKF